MVILSVYFDNTIVIVTYKNDINKKSILHEYNGTSKQRDSPKIKNRFYIIISILYRYYIDITYILGTFKPNEGF